MINHNTGTRWWGSPLKRLVIICCVTVFAVVIMGTLSHLWFAAVPFSGLLSISMRPTP